METCSNCNYIFPETKSLESNVKIPCPECGSTKRTINVSGMSTGYSHASANLTSIINSTPPFSFGAILKVERTVRDGQVISLVDPIYTQLICEIEKNPHIIYEINPRKWEEIISAAYDKAGFDEVILTPRSGDFGRDVIAKKHGFGSVRFIEEIKAYKPGHIVKANEVRALLGVLQSDRDATKAIFSTTSTFAPKIKQDEHINPFIPYRLELIDKEKLLKRLISLLSS